MVSAVFHSATAAKEVKVMPMAAPAPARVDAPPGYDWNDLLMAVMPPVLGMLLLVLIWSLVSMATAGSIPTPIDTAKQAIDIFSDPFYRKGPNDQGVGWNAVSYTHLTLPTN